MMTETEILIFLIAVLVLMGSALIIGISILIKINKDPDFTYTRKAPNPLKYLKKKA